MQWLISQIWILLAVAGFLGLILGLALRGLMGGNKLRRATVERDVARTELGQARAEIDALYASQRKLKEENAGQGAVPNTQETDALKAEIGARDQRLSELEAALQSARDDLEVAQQTHASSETNTDGIKTTGAALAGAAVGAVLGGDDDKVRELEERNVWLEERNVWLEERVQALEADIETLGQASAEVVTPAPVESDEAETSINLTKLEWQNTYLRQRVEALENRMQALPVLAVDNEAEPEEAEAAEVPVVEAHPQQDEEMARLRWRNRYLEGRLAYYEEEANAEDLVEATSEPETTQEDVMEEAVEETPAEEAQVDDAVEIEVEEEISETEVSEAEPEVVEEAESEPAEEAPQEEAAPEETAEEHPAEAVLRSLEGDEAESEEAEAPEEPVSETSEAAQPEAFNEPKDGGDDLTAIGGIGPRIAEVLNGLGIWTYAQIASWTPENAAWVEEHLSFKGRVEREQWIAQAKALIE